jgi:hypothetical protein
MRVVIIRMGLLVFGGIIIILGRPFISWFLRVWLRWLEFEGVLCGLRGRNVKMGGEERSGNREGKLLVLG